MGSGPRLGEVEIHISPMMHRCNLCGEFILEDRAIQYHTDKIYIKHVVCPKDK